ncbi:hook-length control protein FliK [Octadecabacter temperatus]|uniref:Flagellar hook-length control protein FliK n=1 Tax=Octadecabacter temperatus TaxID=1458307 RepID=A0A0K0YA61_9RHOB|nr:flagellar hook-length control protein FliK [Octadecabacter temperatus]AKS47815.1 Flagellar hook-length control protein FliK [Octadecabacter temperatus]SIO38112.1 hook-length control protein FliK [Octadecabacter temperatus]
MIQIDTNSPELGQVAPQGLRDNRADSNSEGSAEFAQIWSEYSEESHDLEVEDAEALPLPHPVEFRLSESERIQTTQPPEDGVLSLQAKTQNDPSTPKHSETLQKPSGGLISELAGPDAVESPEVGEQFVAPPVRSETAGVATPTANPIYPSTPPPHAEKTGVKSVAPLQSNIAPDSSATVSADMPFARENGTKFELLKRNLGTDQASFQKIEHDQNNNARTPIESAIKQAVQATETSVKPRGQVTTSTHTPTDRLPAPDAKQAPLQTDATIPTPVPPPSQERSLAPQSVAKPNLSIPSMETPNALNTEPLFPVSTGILETELTSPQSPQSPQVNAANVSTATTSTSQSIASHVASQVAATIVQSSNSTTEILLNPEELGRVRISLTNGEAGMTVNILSERPETTDLMRRNIEHLARELREMGYENPSFTFGEQPSGSNGTWNDEHQEPAPENPNDTSKPPVPSMRVTLTGGLDLKL